jgi:hypothetical protein
VQGFPGHSLWSLTLAAGLLGGLLVAEVRAEPAREQASVETSAATQSGQDEWAAGRVLPEASAEAARAAENERGGDSPWLAVPRAALSVPRMALKYLVFTPFKVAGGLYNKWQNKTRFRIFVNSVIRTDFRDRWGLGYSTFPLFGRGSGFLLGFSYGGGDFQEYEAEWRRELGESTRLRLQAAYERDGDEQFYGLGMTDPALKTRYFIEELRGTLELRHDWGRALRTELRGGFSRFQTRDARDIAADELPVSALFDPFAISGFGRTLDMARGGLEMRLDLRGSRAGNAVELMLRSHADAYWDTADTGFSTLRYGARLDFGVPVYRARVLALHLQLEAAEPLDDEVPFFLLPSIGEDELMRGYPDGRFRDRLATAAGLEYRWGLSARADATLFTDVGRVFPDFDSFGFKDWQWSIGGGIRIKNERRPILGVQVAYSPESIRLVVRTGSNLF